MSFAPRALLMVRGGEGEGSTIPLVEGTAILGRSALADILVDFPGISRQHAAIQGDANGFSIADMGSRNGTFINGTRIGEEAHRLKNWDRIELDGLDVSWVFMESQDTIDMPRAPQG